MEKMMSDEKLVVDCKERVALDLALRIFNAENNEGKAADSGDRAYWFRLYRQCHELVALNYGVRDISK